MTTEEVSRDIYSPDGKRYGENMTKREKIAWAEYLNERFMPEILMILGFRNDAEAHSVEGTSKDWDYLYDYEIEGTRVQLKGNWGSKSKGVWGTFTLSPGHFKDLIILRDQGQEMPEWHVEYGWHPDSDALIAIARIRVLDLLDWFEKELPRADIGGAWCVNWSDAAKKFEVVRSHIRTDVIVEDQKTWNWSSSSAT